MLFAVGVTYQTPPGKLAAISGMLREAIEGEGKDGVRFERAHFKSFGASSLDFEVVYFVLSPDMKLAMDVQEKINLWLFQRFTDEGIEFAYPTQTVFLESVSADQSAPTVPNTAPTSPRPKPITDNARSTQS